MRLMPERREFRESRERELFGVVAGVAVACFLTWAATLDSYDFKDVHFVAPWSHLVAGGLAAFIWTVLLVGRGRDDPALVLDDEGIHQPRFWSTPWSDVLTVVIERRFGAQRLPHPHVVVKCKSGPDRVIFAPRTGVRANELRKEVERHWLAWCRLHDAPAHDDE